jgi:hypothetical protein
VRPTYAIHLGDVYYAGTPKESRERFLDIIERYGPSKDNCRYFALPGNHDYYNGGYGYFETILTGLGQEASYFTLRNERWQIVGLDSGYEEYGLQKPQYEWLTAQLDSPSRRSIVLSHHQLLLLLAAVPKVSSLLGTLPQCLWGRAAKPLSLQRWLILGLLLASNFAAMFHYTCIHKAQPAFLSHSVRRSSDHKQHPSALCNSTVVFLGIAVLLTGSVSGVLAVFQVELKHCCGLTRASGREDWLGA